MVATIDDDGSGPAMAGGTAPVNIALIGCGAMGERVAQPVAMRTCQGGTVA